MTPTPPLPSSPALGARLRATLCALFVLPALPLFAQAPKLGTDWYTDSFDIGFKVKVPKDWDLVPSQPGEDQLVAAYSPPRNLGFRVGKGAGHEFELVMRLLVFDERDVVPGFDAALRDRAKEWMDRRIPGASSWRLRDDMSPKPLKIRGVESATCAVYEAHHRAARDDPDALIFMYVATIVLEPGLRVCLLGDGPGEKKWHSYENSWSRMAKSFTRVEIETPSELAEANVDPNSPRAKKRAELLREVGKLPGWELFETENYFIVTDIDDKKFIDELMEKAEAIRKVYEADYPPHEARAIAKTKAAKRQTRAGSDDSRSSVAATDPMLLSRSSVIRVCSSEEMYLKYGGEAGTAGFWNPSGKELVIYDDKPRSETWLVLNHEAFHQYIYYFYGEIAPHSWYSEGTGDFYSGYVYKHKRFTLKEAPWRVRTIQENLRRDRYVPLRELVTWRRRQFYAENERYDVDGTANYAQGWSLIYFLRTGPERRPKGWNSAWSEILDRYLEVLATSGDLERAVAVAFADVDWEAFEKSWKSYTLSL